MSIVKIIQRYFSLTSIDCELSIEIARTYTHTPITCVSWSERMKEWKGKKLSLLIYTHIFRKYTINLSN